MICQHCKDQNHDQCPQGTWCDCGHRVRNVAITGHPDAGSTTMTLDVGDNDEAPRPIIGYVSPETLDLIDLATTARSQELAPQIEEARTGSWVRRERPQRKEEP